MAHPGEAISYTITLDNPGAAEITGVQLTDNLPAHLGLCEWLAYREQRPGILSEWGDFVERDAGSARAGAGCFRCHRRRISALNQSITNTAEIQGGGEVFLRNAAVLIEPYQIEPTRTYLPVILRQCLSATDNFSNPASGWFVGDDGDYRYEYLNGEYRILVRPAPGLAGVESGFQASDYSVSVDLRNPNGRDGSYGIAFGIADDGMPSIL